MTDVPNDMWVHLAVSPHHAVAHAFMAKREAEADRKLTVNPDFRHYAIVKVRLKRTRKSKP